MINIAGRITELRNEKGVSGLALSQMLSFPRHAVERFESGRQTPNKEQQEKLANYFGVSIAYLRGETNDPTRQDSWMDLAYDSDASSQAETEQPSQPDTKARAAKAVAKAEVEAVDDSAFISALLRSSAAQKIIREIVQDELQKRNR